MSPPTEDRAADLEKEARQRRGLREGASSAQHEPVAHAIPLRYRLALSLAIVFGGELFLYVVTNGNLAPQTVLDAVVVNALVVGIALLFAVRELRQARRRTG